jgi:DNA-damage-inducible protein J
MAKIEIDITDDLMKDIEELFQTIGLDTTTAINLFLRQSLRYGGIPFDITINKAEIVNDKLADKITRDVFNSLTTWIVEDRQNIAKKKKGYLDESQISLVQISNDELAKELKEENKFDNEWLKQWRKSNP